ncbi:palmitoyltransferase ZDHHC16A [Arctopsyche grandis]|uniref:palmitoyltransferase ZDHHC16A n=1 Tax=Arctopsyche grandis TaxID=121162 RepID=UPI00406D99CE
MVKLFSLRWRIFMFPRTIRHKFQRAWSEFSLTMNSLTYNHHVNANYVTDVLLEPVFWFVDNFAGSLGKFFVLMVSLLTSSVVFIAYWLGLPYWWERNPTVTIFLMIFGHWLLVNIIFHYYKAVVTSPGHPPEASLIVEAVSICRKCIAPKPPRSHHCSVCNTCVLCMDHHCPWLNNCVGHFNRRHFYLYMVYMVIGVFFIIIAGIDIGYVVLWVGDETSVPSENEPDLIGHPVHMNNTGALIPVLGFPEYDNVILPREHKLPVPKLTFAQKIAADPAMRRAVIYMAIINVAVLLSLGTLVVWHGKLITKGETSVESHINQAEMRRLGKAFRNPFDFGPKKNWRVFLGLVGGRSIFFNVILPSGHHPVGSGLVWHTVHDTYEDWP